MTTDRRTWMVGCGIAAVSAILFATKGVLIKLVLDDGADATALLGVRVLISLPCFAVAAWWYGRGLAPISRREMFAIAVLGMIMFHLSSWLDMQGLRFIGVGLERIVLYIYPPLAVGLAWAIGRGRPSGVLVVACLSTWVGVAVSCIDQPTQGEDMVLGVALVAAAAAAYAIHLVGIEPFMRRHGGARVAALAFCLASGGVMLHVAYVITPAQWHAQPASIWTLGAVLAIAGTVVPALLAGVAIRRIGSGPSAVIGTIGPGVTVLLAWAVLGERPGAMAWIGFAITVAGGLAVGLFQPRR